MESSWGIIQEGVYLRKRLLPEGGKEVPGASTEPLVLRAQPVGPRVHHLHLLPGLLQLLLCKLLDNFSKSNAALFTQHHMSI